MKIINKEALTQITTVRPELVEGLIHIAQTEKLAAQVGKALGERGLMLVTAESCTGGGLGYAITSVAGSSEWFDRGFITYTDIAKQEMLGVSATTLQQYGAVAEKTAQEMAAGALAKSHAQVSVAITGIAGPGGATAQKPVGMVCFAWATKNANAEGLARSHTQHFSGDRQAVRQQSIAVALKGVLDLLGDGGVEIA